CGEFHGWVMAIDARDPSKRGAWATGGIGEGIWASGGMASDGVGVFATTGNRTRQHDSPHQDSEQLVRITGMGTRADVFIPRRWREMDRDDADFAGVNPVFVELPGSKPARIVVAIAKDGHLYILDAGSLGGLGGEKRDLRVASQSDSVRTVPTVYRT